MLGRLKEAYPDIPITVTYGAATKRARKDLGLKKTHSNDAYSMGSFHPEHRTDLKHYRKKRRNNRILERFYDAGYLDIRDGKKKSGAVLSCGRTRRAEPAWGKRPASLPWEEDIERQTEHPYPEISAAAERYCPV